MRYLLSYTSCEARRGYIALISTLALTVILTSFAVTASFSGVMTRLSVLAIEDGWSAGHNARACTRVAMLYLSQDSDYLPPTEGETVTIGNEVCRIAEVQYQDSGTVIRTEARVGDSTQHIQAMVHFPATGVPYVRSWEKL